MPGAPSKYGLYEPLKGVREDFTTILQKFEEKNDVRYESFNAVWKEMKTQYLFAGRQIERECREFSEECLRLLVEMWQQTSNFLTKVGVFYLMYSVYFVQPLFPKCKIRIPLSVWKELQQFIEEVKSQMHLDIEFIFNTLKYHNAFDFVAAVPWATNTGRTTGASQSQFHDQQQVLKDEPCLITSILEPDHIDQLSAIHEHYHRMKCQLGGGKPLPSLNVIQTNLVQVITKSVASHEEWRKTQVGKKGRKRRDSGQMTTSESDPDSDSDYQTSPRRQTRSISNVRAEIRSRAFATAGSVQRHRPWKQIGSPEFNSPPHDSSQLDSPPSATMTTRGRKRTVSSTDSPPEKDVLPIVPKEDGLLSMPLLEENDEEADTLPPANKKKKKNSKKKEAQKKEKPSKKNADESPSSKSRKVKKISRGQTTKKGKPSTETKGTPKKTKKATPSKNK